MEKKRRSRRGNKSLILVIVLLTFLASAYRGIQILALEDKLNLAMEKKEHAARLYEEEIKRGEELEKLKMNIKTKKFIEEVAREKFGLTYKNEIIFEPENE